MDLDATEDSLSSPAELRASGQFSILLSSSSTEEPPSEKLNGHQVGTQADSFEFSPATDTLAEDGGFLLVGHRHSVDEEGLMMTSPNELRREIDDNVIINEETEVSEHSHVDDEAFRTSYRGRSDPPNTSNIHIYSPVMDRVNNRRDAARRNGHNNSDGLRKLSRHGLERSIRSWPSRDRVAKSARSSRDFNSPSMASVNDFSQLSSPSMARESAARSGDTRRNRVRDIIDGAASEMGSVERGSGDCDGDCVHPVESVVIQSSIDEPLLGENLSVCSDGSSRGLPPPPAMPSGPLPAIGALRQHLLTREQSDMIDRERRLTTDHMRRLNQVLAGHLSYSEVPRVHSDREASESSFAAPQHVASAGDFASRLTPRVGGEDAAGYKSRASPSAPWLDQRFRRVITRIRADFDRRALFRGWSRLCLHAAIRKVTEAPSAITSATERVSSAETQREAAASPEQTVAAGRDLHKKLKEAGVRLILRNSLRADRRAKARGWAKLLASAAFSAATASSPVGSAERLVSLETYVIELQQQAILRKRELDRKTRALSVLLRDDWAKVALEREREIRAVRVQLAQTEADLDEQLDTMVESLASAKEQGGTGRKDEHSSEGCGDAVRNTSGENYGNPAEVFVGEAGAEGGMVALQGEGARKLQAYLASNGRRLKRARAEAQQWRARCEAMESGFHNTLDGVIEGRAPSMTQGNGLIATLLKMLDKRDRRLSDLYKDLAALTAGCTQSFPEDKSVDRRRCSRRKAAEILLRQMSAAGEEARSHLGRLLNEVRLLETALADAKGTPGRPAGFPVDRSTGYTLKNPSVRATTHQYEYRSSMASEAGVQTATDAYDLISSLRSEVSALERHRTALQSRLECQEETVAASTINNTPTTAVAERVSVSDRNCREETADTAMRGRPAAEAPGAVDGAAPAGAHVVSNPARARQARRKDRRARAAEILLQALQGGEGPREGRRWTRASADGATMPTTGDTDMSVLAAAARLKREFRNCAQEAFASKKAAEVR